MTLWAPPSYDAFGLIGTTFKELDWKALVFFREIGPDKSKRMVGEDPRDAERTKDKLGFVNGPGPPGAFKQPKRFS